MSNLTAVSLACVVAGIVALVATPALRRLAITAGFVDKPGAHKRHFIPVPYLGGVAIFAATLLGKAVDGEGGTDLSVVLIGGALLAIIGLVDDDRSLGPRIRLLAQVGATLPLLAAGIRISVSGIPAFDAVLTVAWVVGITNAVNFLDNMDGLAAGLTAVASAGAMAMAISSDQYAVAGLAGALFGACVGFLPYNLHNARIYMGDAGSLFIGYVLAVVSLQVSPGITPPASFIVPALIVALPLLDIAMVVLARIRRGIRVAEGGRNHLSHRLVVRGLSPLGSVSVLVGIEAVAVFLAFAVSTRRLTVAGAVVCAVPLLGGLVATTIKAPVFTQPPTGMPRSIKLAALGGGLGIGALAAPGLFVLLTARSDVSVGIERAEAGIHAMAAGDIERADAEFRAGVASFRSAERRLGSPLASLSLAVPVLNSNLQASRMLARVGSTVTTSGAELARTVEPSTLTVARGRVDTDRLSALQPQLANAGARFRAAIALVERSSKPFLVPPVERSVNRLRDSLPGAATALERAESTAALLPDILGRNGSRSYVVIVRDAGVGSVNQRVSCGILTANRDAVSLVPGHSCTALVGSDTPTAAEMADGRGFEDFAARVVTRSEGSGTAVDGVFGVDTAGLARLGCMVPQRACSPLAFESASFDFARDIVARAAGTGVEAGQAVGSAIRAGDVAMYFTRPAEQRLAHLFEASGTPNTLEANTVVLPVPGPRDRHEDQRPHYEVFIDPDAGAAKVTTSPSTTSVVAAGPGPWYRIELMRAPLQPPAQVELAVRVPSGWRIEGTDSVHIALASGRQVTVDDSVGLRFKIERTGVAGLLERLWEQWT